MSAQTARRRGSAALNLIESPPLPTRLLALGDLHGDAGALVRFLLGNQLVEPTPDGRGLRWLDPDAVVVQCGDVPDRGCQTLLITSLVSNLRGQGARIYTLLGNHDVAYLVAPESGEQRRRIEQALSYMVDEQGRCTAEMDDVQRIFLTQAGAISALHRHPLGGLVALRLGHILFCHCEPVPGGFDESDYACLAESGEVRYEPRRHSLAHPIFWGRPYSCGTADLEGGYLPRNRPIIPPARGYEERTLALHAEEPEVREMYLRFADLGIRTIVHGHIPGPTVRRYRLFGIEHVNIDEAISGYYRQLFDPIEVPEESTFVPTGWTYVPA